MKTMLYIGLLLAGALMACSPPESSRQKTSSPGGLSETIQRPLDKAESVDDTIMRAKQERDRQLEEQQ